ncbi:uncharacterized protein LOC134220991 [Armigeres subalbatus]|uniref:uncharacterized protein LOC134220991 n=1 Tax=Armigeres subalbatus TaxID=124917 RepID=UPI002ED0EA6D
MFKLVACIAVLGLVACYDFKDSFYNELILEDILDSEDTPTMMDRFKRSTAETNDDKCKRHHHRHRCCNDANDEKMEKFHETHKQCLSENRSNGRSARGKFNPVDMFDCEKMKKIKQDHICAMECVNRKLETVDKEGNLVDREALIQFAKNSLAADMWQEDVLGDMVDACLKEVTDKTEKLKASGEPTTCNPSSSIYGYCMWHKITLACPKEKQVTSKRCDRMREMFANKEVVDNNDVDDDN